MLWTLFCIFTSETVSRVFLDGLFSLGAVCSEKWKGGGRGRRPRPTSWALLTSNVSDIILHFTHESEHMWKLCPRNKMFTKFVRAGGPRGGDVFAFLGQKSLLTVSIPGKVKAAPFREVIGHILRIPDTFCQNYPIPDHLNWACDILKIYLWVFHLSNENKDK